MQKKLKIKTQKLPQKIEFPFSVVIIIESGAAMSISVKYSVRKSSHKRSAIMNMFQKVTRQMKYQSQIYPYGCRKASFKGSFLSQKFKIIQCNEKRHKY